jgi:hypothetical protein
MKKENRDMEESKIIMAKDSQDLGEHSPCS